MRWLDTQTGNEADARSSAFWARLSSDVHNGEFWAGRIKNLRDDPPKRLRVALDNLPLPAAFREAAVALRTIIRELRKVKEDVTEPLRFHYWLAAVESFLIDYAPLLQEPGYNVMQSIPGSVIQSLDFSYADLGYEHLRILNRTDVKWLVEAWGEPKAHREH